MSVGPIDLIANSITDIIASCVVIGFGVNVLNAYIYVIGPQFVWNGIVFTERAIWSNILNIWILLCLKANKLTDIHYLLAFGIVYDSAAFIWPLEFIKIAVYLHSISVVPREHTVPV